MQSEGRISDVQSDIKFKADKPDRTIEDVDHQLRMAAKLFNAGQQLKFGSTDHKDKILILDFDAVMAIAWSEPEEPYPGVVDLLRKISTRSDVHLCMASFNPLAIDALKRWGVYELFTAVRAGSNDPNGDRTNLSKSSQIKSMITSELKHVKDYAIAFYDDDFKNIGNVFGFCEVSCFYVVDGLKEADIELSIGDVTCMDEILPRLYVGSEDAAADLNLLKKHEITHVLTESPTYFTGIVQKRLPTFNYGSWTNKEFEDMIDFIDKGRTRGKVLVHCFMGHNRSVATAITYMMWKFNYSWEEALAKVRLSRSNACPTKELETCVKEYFENYVY